MTNQAGQSTTNQSGSGTQTGGDGGEGQQQQQAEATFEAFYGALPDDHKALVDSHIASLKTALASERANADRFGKELKKMQKQVEEGSDAHKTIQAMRDQLSAAQKQAKFYEAAQKANVNNLKLAWTVAQTTEGLVDDDGTVDFERFKTDFPQLFIQPQPNQQKKAPTGNAGNGTGANGQQAQTFDMNANIRAAAGVQAT